MSRFKVGDRVIVLWAGRPEPIGTVTTVIDIVAANDMAYRERSDHPMPGTTLYELDIASRMLPGKNVFLQAAHLEPYRDDGSERGEWTAELRKLCNVSEDA